MWRKLSLKSKESFLENGLWSVASKHKPKSLLAASDGISKIELGSEKVF